MSIKYLLQAASKVVNSTLGDVCVYEHKSGDLTTDVNITIERNKIIKDSNGFIAGYGVEASILISQIPKVYGQEKFTDEDGVTWEIAQLTKQTKTKWYVDIIELG